MLNQIEEYANSMSPQGADILLSVWGSSTVIYKLMDLLDGVADCGYDFIGASEEPPYGAVRLDVHSVNPFASLLAACEINRDLLNRLVKVESLEVSLHTCNPVKPAHPIFLSAGGEAAYPVYVCETCKKKYISVFGMQWQEVLD